MWTVERDQWFLAEMKSPDGRALGYVILNAKGGNPVFEDPKEFAYVSEQMRKAGARVLSYEEWNEEEDKLLNEYRQKKGIIPKTHGES
jgi:hypothetical protein